MGNALIAARLDTGIAWLLSEQQKLSGVSLRELSRLSGVKLTHLGDVLKRGRAATAGEIERIADCPPGLLRCGNDRRGEAVLVLSMWEYLSHNPLH